MSAKNGIDPLRQALGAGFLNRIQEKPEDCPLRIGNTVYTTNELATKLGVVHRAAAVKLTEAAEAIGARSVQDFYKKSTPYSFASIPRFGDTTLYVAWHLFRVNGLDPRKWFERGQEEARVTFHSLKLRAQKRGDLMSEEKYEKLLKRGRILRKNYRRRR